MNKSVLWLAGAVLAGAAWALDPPRPAAPPAATATEPPAQEEAAPTPGPAASPPAAAGDSSSSAPVAAEAEPDESLPPLPPGARSTGPTPQRFDPTEKVRADFPVAFPIDI